MSFHKILKKHLQGKNLSQIARELGIPKTLLHEWVQTSRTPSFKNIQHVKKLADYLSLSLNELLIGEQNENLIKTITFSDENKRYRIRIDKLP